jgi:[acyl-carrier-protein] S-malonyltransferase
MTLAFTFGGGMAMEAPGMELHDRFPTIRDWMAQVAEWTAVPVDRLLTEDFTAAFYSGDISAHPDLRFVAEVRQAAYSMGIADVLADRGIRPDVIGGSSLGFMIGATLAGAIERRALFDYLRASTSLPLHPESEQPRAIAVCTVAHEEGVDAYRGDRPGVHLACEIGQFIDGKHGMYMFSGYVDELRELAASKEAGLVHVITVLGGAHSPPQRFHHDLMAPHVATMTFRDPQVPLISGLSDRTLTTADEVRTDLLRNSTTTTRMSHVINGLAREGTQLALVLGVASAVGMFVFPFPVYPVSTPEDFDGLGTAVYDAGVVLTFG